jgi:hypothetical protein
MFSNKMFLRKIKTLVEFELQRATHTHVFLIISKTKNPNPLSSS